MPGSNSDGFIHKFKHDSLLVVTAIILWNTRYLERVFAALKERGNPVREDLIPHISPLAWEHINLTGDYVWKLSRQVAAGQFRPLRKPGQ